MDPNETLEYLREHFEDFRNGQPLDAEAVEALFSGLDEWLSKGGFFPAKWMLGRSFEQRMSLKACETCGTWHSRCP